MLQFQTVDTKPCDTAPLQSSVVEVLLYAHASTHGDPAADYGSYPRNKDLIQIYFPAGNTIIHYQLDNEA